MFHLKQNTEETKRAAFGKLDFGRGKMFQVISKLGKKMERNS